MLQNAYLLAKIGGDTAENEQNLPKFCQKLATTLRVPPAARRMDSGFGAWTAALAYRPVLPLSRLNRFLQKYPSSDLLCIDVDLGE